MLRLCSVQGFPLYEDTDLRRATAHQLYCFAIEVGFGANGCITLLDMDCFIYNAALSAIGAKPNIYCEAIELVCGGSPKVCVLVERKALDRVKSEL